MTIEAVVFVVDDDDAVRMSLRMLLESDGLRVRDFPDAESFLAACPRDAHGCLVSDIRMPGFSGLELQAQLAGHGVRLPIIMLTGHADVPTAVHSLKAGAIDFMEKPFEPATLLAQVRHAIDLDATRLSQEVDSARRQELVERLTPREQEVIARVSAGHSNKVIATELSISERTVELHRGRAMHKLEVRSVAELVRLMVPPGEEPTGR
jgi:two-component system response regulator FixJ